MTSHLDARESARTQGTYDVYIDVDCDCQELLDAIGLDYTTSDDDESQNEVKVVLNEEEFCDVFETVQLTTAALEQVFGGRILNTELGEYTTRVQVYTPQGDKICFS